MARRRRRRERRDRSSARRLAVNLGRAATVVLASAAVGYAFYLALLWVAAEAARRGPGG